MKKLKKLNKLLFIPLFFTAGQSFGQSQPQTQAQTSQIVINAEGKIKVIPDQVFISVSVESTGVKATDVKRENDIAIEKVLTFIQKNQIPKGDFSTEQVSLNQQYDYEGKKKSFNATQTIHITLRDLSKYEKLMEGIVEVGVNRIDQVEFKSSKINEYLIDARKLAIKNAKQKANDYLSELPGQKLGKAIMISETENHFYPTSRGFFKAEATSMDAPRETLAVGELEVNATVTVTFLIE